MSEKSSIEQSGILRRIDGMVDKLHGASAVLLTTLAFGAGGVALENSFETSVADAQMPTALSHANHRRYAQVQEYVKVVADDADGKPLPRVPKNTFAFIEQCEDGGQKTSRIVTYKQPNSQPQPLGSCDVDSAVTVTEQAPRQGHWQDESGTKEKISKATKKNNHSIFTEREEGSVGSPPLPPANHVGTPPEQPPNNPGEPGGGEVGSPPVPPTPEDPDAPGNIGADVSWAQCDGPNSADTTIGNSLSGLSYVIVDLEGGLGFSANPCLKSEVADITAAGIHMDFYINTGLYLDSSHASSTSPNVCAAGDEVCIANNYGSANASFAIQTASDAGINISGKRIFRDGETSNTWVTEANGQANAEDAQENEASLQGAKDTLIAGGASDSLLYENQDFENVVLDGLQTGEPLWLATGADSAAQAEASCNTPGPDGGVVELAQFNGETSTGIALDEEIVC